MKKAQVQVKDRIQYIHPEETDGGEMWNIAKSSNVLDLNSTYSYLMMTKYFKETCIIAKEDETMAGFVTAFIPPTKQDTIFVWQIAVSADYQGLGIGTKLLHAVIESEACKDVSYLEATISPSNKASQRLFTSFSRKKGTKYKILPCFSKNHFPDGDHEEELCYRIGPL